jgi:hypothetical protein
MHPHCVCSAPQRASASASACVLYCCIYLLLFASKHSQCCNLHSKSVVKKNNLEKNRDLSAILPTDCMRPRVRLLQSRRVACSRVLSDLAAPHASTPR